MREIHLCRFQTVFDLQRGDFVNDILLFHGQNDSGACEIRLASNLLQDAGKTADGKTGASGNLKVSKLRLFIR